MTLPVMNFGRALQMQPQDPETTRITTHRISRPKPDPSQIHRKGLVSCAACCGSPSRHSCGCNVSIRSLVLWPHAAAQCCSTLLNFCSLLPSFCWFQHTGCRRWASCNSERIWRRLKCARGEGIQCVHCVHKMYIVYTRCAQRLCTTHSLTWLLVPHSHDAMARRLGPGGAAEGRVARLRQAHALSRSVP